MYPSKFALMLPYLIIYNYVECCMQIPLFDDLKMERGIQQNSPSTSCPYNANSLPIRFQIQTGRSNQKHYSVQGNNLRGSGSPNLYYHYKQSRNFQNHQPNLKSRICNSGNFHIYRFY